MYKPVGYNPYAGILSKFADPYTQQLKELDTRRPDRPEFESLLGEDGLLGSQYRLSDQMNTEALDKYRSEAMRDPSQQSAWAQLANQELGLQRSQAQDSVARQGANLQSQMLADMAARGGYDQSSQARMGQMSFRDMLRQKQNNRQEFDQKAMDIFKTDEQNRIGQLQNAVGFDQQRASYMTGLDSANQGAALAEIQNQRNFDQTAYGQDLNAWGSERNAVATERAASKQSCFAPGTMIKLKFGTEKAVENITLGDEFLHGGRVRSIFISSPKFTDTLFSYNGTLVTGHHAVIEDGKFVRVKDSKIGIEQKGLPEKVYNFSTENHRIAIGNDIFADFDETDFELTPSHSLKELNLSLRKELEQAG